MFQDSVPAGSYNDPFLSSVCAALSLGEMFSLDRMLEPLSATVSPSLPLKKERFACRAENLKRYKCEHVSKCLTR